MRHVAEAEAGERGARGARIICFAECFVPGYRMESARCHRRTSSFSSGRGPSSVNCAGEGSPTTSAVISPEGEAVAWQPYGKEGVLVADVALELATGALAKRLRP